MTRKTINLFIAIKSISSYVECWCIIDWHDKCTQNIDDRIDGERKKMREEEEKINSYVYRHATNQCLTSTLHTWHFIYSYHTRWLVCAMWYDAVCCEAPKYPIELYWYSVIVIKPIYLFLFFFSLSFSLSTFIIRQVFWDDWRCSVLRCSLVQYHIHTSQWNSCTNFAQPWCFASLCALCDAVMCVTVCSGQLSIDFCITLHQGSHWNKNIKMSAHIIDWLVDYFFLVPIFLLLLVCLFWPTSVGPSNVRFTH